MEKVKYINIIGTYYYVNGDKYVGEWKYNLRHGKGCYKINYRNFPVCKWQKGLWRMARRKTCS